MNTSVVTNSVFRGFFEKQKLTGPNFIDWYRQLRIVLSVEDKLDYLEQPIPPTPVLAQAGQQVAPEALVAHTAWVEGSKEIIGLMLMTMKPGASSDYESFHSCKQEERQSVSSYVLKMKSYIDNLQCLGHPMSLNLGVSLILISLRKEFDSFMQNYNIHSMGKTVNELHAMLKLYEQTLTKKDLALHKQSQGASGSGIFTIELYTFPNKSGVYDTSCGTHICNTTQGHSESRKLKLGALSLYVGNGQRVAVEAIIYYHLCLSSGLVIVSNNCHYAPSITRGIISVSRLYKDGYVNCFMDNEILVSKNNLVYFSAILMDGIFEIDLSNSNTIDSSMYVVSNKRAKLNLNYALLWHRRLEHINKKRIEKLQDNGLLNSTDLKAFEKCVSCMSGKMARKPYTHQVERAKDLLGLIHTDDLVDLPPNGKIVGSKWLFKKKTDMDGTVHTFKARLIAKGFTQTYRVDYKETLSSVADIKAIKILIAIAAYYDYEIWKMDRFHMENSKRESIPMQEKLRLSKSQGASTPAELKRMQNVPYASVNQSDFHWTTVKNILKYLKNTKDMFLVYEDDIKRELKVSCYTDAGNLMDTDDLKSQTRYVLVLNGGVVDWKSTKQSIFAASSAEAEYIAAYDASKEAIPVGKFIFRLGVIPIIEEPINIYCDNT
uniref:Zinc finger, CCHC-type n=1 Tax=Tanacetum cinerariifolium TaxID=118510 RepID=A0A6L2MGI9_TANCI|nr:zinc finger, CCHC-type [Tanacetum cinerariifolium]